MQVQPQSLIPFFFVFFYLFYLFKCGKLLCEILSPYCVKYLAPIYTSERGGEGDCVKGGGGEEGKCERERALERLRYYNPGH
jgi:hypothetical protein